MPQPGPTTDTDVLIIGAGPVGLFQAFQLGLLDLRSVLVDVLPHAGGQCTELYPDKPIYDIPAIAATTGRELAASLLSQLQPFVQGGRCTFHGNQQIQSLIRTAEGRFEAITSAGLRLGCKAVVIAAGAGAFVPRKLRLAGIEQWEGQQVFYSLPLPAKLAGQDVVIQGDDDQALQWAIDLSGQTGPLAPASITLVHRRAVFSAEPQRVAQMQALCNEGRIRFVAGQFLSFQASGNRLHQLTLLEADGRETTLPASLLLASLGLSPKLGPLADWGLELQKKQIPVDTARFQTAIPGIFAVGDINTYPGKKKLIVCGFHECVLAAFAAAEIVLGQAPLLQYTTTSTRLHALLGVTPEADN